MIAIGRTSEGRVRENNEDAIFISKPNDILKKLCIVADGMGGHLGGEVASSSAISAFNEYIGKNYDPKNAPEEILEAMVGGVQFANRKVCKMGFMDPELEGMGTTFTAVCIHNKKMYYVHVGDSRIYVFNSGKLQQLTHDHSYVMDLVKMGQITADEARVHPKRNIITRALGIPENIDVDTGIYTVNSGDLILLCTDGLNGMLTDEEISEILGTEESIKKKADELVAKANELGGHDNISVILLG